MNFSIKELDQVIEQTGCTYEDAKLALLDADGNVEEAVASIMKEKTDRTTRYSDFAEAGERTADSILAKVREIIESGNASKLIIRDGKGHDVFTTNLTTTAAVGGVVALAGGGPLLVVSALIAKFGLNYRFVVITKDGKETVI